MSRIELVTHPYAWETMQARIDQARITKQPLFQNPWWYQDAIGPMYHGIYGCIGWPTEVTEQDPGRPGYAAVVGVVRSSDKLEVEDTSNAPFLVLAEAESNDVPTLLAEILKMRDEFGFGLRPDTLSYWHGDDNRFTGILARRNEWLTRKNGEKAAIVVTPPEDWLLDSKQRFDLYVRVIQSSLLPGKQRLYFGKCNIAREKLHEFKRDEPFIIALGGLLHTLLSQTLWMGDMRDELVRMEI